MNQQAASILQFLKHRSGVAAALSLQHFGWVHESGWFRSVREKAAVDLSGSPIPWLSYPCISFLQKRSFENLIVFEFGAGNSTLWWAARCKKVISCEAHAEWYAQIAPGAPPTANIINVAEDNYPATLLAQPTAPNIIVIDGGNRNACAAAALQALAERGVIIWDDSDRVEYKEGIDNLLANGFRQLEFTGLGPIVNISKETSIFYRPENILGI